MFYGGGNDWVCFVVYCFGLCVVGCFVGLVEYERQWYVDWLYVVLVEQVCFGWIDEYCVV